MIATASTSAVATVLVGVLANRPFVVVPAMGVNAYVAVMTDNGRLGPQTRAAIVVAGLVLMLLAASGLLQRISSYVPASLKTATVAGIGVFIAQIGAGGAGFVVQPNDIGDLTSGSVWLFVAGVLVLLVLVAKRVGPAMLLIIVAVRCRASLARGACLTVPCCRAVLWR